MRFWALVAVLLLADPVRATTPVDVVKQCLEDVGKLPVEQAQDTIYFYKPTGYSAKHFAGYTFHSNLLSTQADFGRLRVVTKEIVAAKKSDYGWDVKLFDKLALLDPYFHEAAIIKTGSTYATYWRGGQGLKAGWYRNEVAKRELKIAVPHRVLLRNCKKEIDALYELTNSNAPVLRFDWFFNQTAVCEDREVGYYEMLGIKNRADAEVLSGLDRKLVDVRQKQMNAYLYKSGVAVNNRAMEWRQAYDGDWWVTLDSFKDTGKNNVGRLLDKDIDHDAEEIYGTLPNGLPLMIASDKNGVLQRVVPSKIATNKNPINNDANIHVPLSCVQCHVEVIRPFQCDGRKLYQREIRLESPDYAKFLRLKRLYLGDIYSVLDRSQKRYAAAIRDCNGLTPADNAAVYAEIWREYLEVSLGPAEVAAELGIPQDRVLRVIGKYIKAGLSDPVLSGLTQVDDDGKPDPIRIRREQWEEVQGLIWEWLGAP